MCSRRPPPPGSVRGPTRSALSETQDRARADHAVPALNRHAVRGSEAEFLSFRTGDVVARQKAPPGGAHHAGTGRNGREPAPAASG